MCVELKVQLPEGIVLQRELQDRHELRRVAGGACGPQALGGPLHVAPVKVPRLLLVPPSIPTLFNVGLFGNGPPLVVGARCLERSVHARLRAEYVDEHPDCCVQDQVHQHEQQKKDEYWPFEDSVRPQDAADDGKSDEDSKTLAQRQRCGNGQEQEANRRH